MVDHPRFHYIFLKGDDEVCVSAVAVLAVLDDFAAVLGEIILLIHATHMLPNDSLAIGFEDRKVRIFRVEVIGKP